MSDNTKIGLGMIGMVVFIILSLWWLISPIMSTK